MAVFSYRAATLDGEPVEGVMEAPGADVAADRLKNAGLIPISVTAPRDAVERRRNRLKTRRGDLLTFTTELSSLLKAGLPLDRSLSILAEISESKAMKAITQSILTAIREGGTFSDALGKHPNTFSPLYVNMVRAGEAGGVISIILEKLNEFLETSDELRNHVTSAMIYPAILGLTGAASVVILLTFVLPRFSVIFSEMGGALPITTQALLAASNGLRTYWWVGLITIAGLVSAFKVFLRTEEGRRKWDLLKLKCMGDVVLKLETARFCRTFGTLLQSGIPVLQALNHARDVVSNIIIATGIDKVPKGAKEGRGIAGPLAEAKVLPQLALSMIRVGEETGQLDTMLLQVAVAYEKSLREAVKRFMGLLEPALILCMGLIIGFIVVSMLTAVFSIMDVPF